jgi:hypothetical protein
LDTDFVSKPFWLFVNSWGEKSPFLSADGAGRLLCFWLVRRDERILFVGAGILISSVGRAYFGC